MEATEQDRADQADLVVLVEVMEEDLVDQAAVMEQDLADQAAATERDLAVQVEVMAIPVPAPEEATEEALVDLEEFTEVAEEEEEDMVVGLHPIR